MKKTDILKAVDAFDSQMDGGLHRLLPEMLELAMSLIHSRQRGLILTSKYNGDGRICTNGRTMGTYFHTADSRGIFKSKATKDRTEGPYTRSTPMSQEEFLKWISQSQERSVDVYRHLRRYISDD